MERNDEVKGQGNSYNTYFRQLDPRLGRWLSLDPKTSSLPGQSPYNSMDGNPIQYGDPLGDKIRGNLGGLIRYFQYKVHLRKQTAIATARIAQAIANKDFRGAAVLSDILNDLQSQSNRLDALKKSEVTFYYNSKSLGGDPLSQGKGLVKAHQNKKKKGRVDIFIEKEMGASKAMENIAFGNSISDLLLNEKFSFYKGNGDYTDPFGQVSDQNDLEQSMKSGLLININLTESTSIIELKYDILTGVASTEASTARDLPVGPIGLSDEVPTVNTKEAIHDDYGRTYKDQMKSSSYKGTEIYYDKTRKKKEGPKFVK